jgi:hypothetical protein
MIDSDVWTGPTCYNWKGDDKGQKKPDYVYLHQGNDITSEKVIKEAKKKFKGRKGCESKKGEGDVDCPEGIEFVNVAYLKLLTNTGPMSSSILRAILRGWTLAVVTLLSLLSRN